MNARYFFFRLLIVTQLFLTGIPSLSAQTAAEVLDRVAAKLQKSKNGYSATFHATVFKGTRETATTSGTLLVKGKKYKVVSDNITTWFDGTTQWSMIAGSDEVNVTTPSAQEMQQLNPYALLNTYRQGYSKTMQTSTKNGVKQHEITLISTGKALFPKVIIIVDGNYSVRNLRLRDSKGDWLRFRIGTIKTGLTLDDATFRFNKTDYPDIDIIDLR